MIKNVFVLNGNGRAGKGTFAEYLDKYIPTYNCSIADLPKKAAMILGWDGVSKTEKDRKFLSDILDLATEYNDSPFEYCVSMIEQFSKVNYEVLLIDMRDPKDIRRAVESYGVKTILVRNPRNSKIESNHADANVEEYDYDYIIENDGTLEQLEKVARLFANEIIRENNIPNSVKPLVLTCSKY